MRDARHLAFLLFAAATACAGGEPPATSLDIAGFSTPESVLHDATADVYLVSNINGSPVDKDDNGFISRVNPDGSVAALKWIDGASPDVTLNAPKGLTIVGDTLFVADIDAVRLFNRTSGAPIGSWPVPGATFLNDLTHDASGQVYVTDSGLRMGDGGLVPDSTDGVWTFRNGAATPVARGTQLGNPNGILFTGQGLEVVTFGSSQIYTLTRDGQITNVRTPPRGSLDGVVALTDGSLLVSSWDAQAVYHVMADGTFPTVVDSVEAPADIGWDATRHRVLIPSFTGNRVVVRTIE